MEIKKPSKENARLEYQLVYQNAKKARARLAAPPRAARNPRICASA